MRRHPVLRAVLGWLIGCGLLLGACNPRAGQPTATAPPPTPTPDPSIPPTPLIDRQGRLLPVTTLRDNITTDTTWSAAGSPYRMVLPIRIDEGATLTIEPDVLIYAEVDVGLNVYGALNMDGVYIRSWEDNERWHGVTFFNPTTPSLVANSRITGARNAFSCNGGFPTLIGNDIGPVAVNGVVCFIRASVPYEWSIANNTIHDTGQAGIQFWVEPTVLPGSPMQITGNTITNTGFTGIGIGSTEWLQRVWANASLNLLISENQIQTTAAEGILLQYVAGVTLRRNTVAFATQSGLALQPTQNVLVEYNRFTQGQESGIRIEEVDGQPYRNNTIQCNLIDFNAVAGIEVLRAETLSLDSLLTIRGNDITNNTRYGLWAGGAPVPLDAANNWWGTVDAAAVAERVYDQLDDPAHPPVNVQPLRASAPVREPGFCP